LDDVYGDIEIERVVNDGQIGILSPLCDVGPLSMDMVFNEVGPKIEPDFDCDPILLNVPTTGLTNGPTTATNGGEDCVSLTLTFGP